MDIEELVTPEWRERLAWITLSPQLRQTIAEYALHNFSLASPVTGRIDEIKYKGHLVILDDATRWEVGEFDADDVAYWNSFDEVAILNGVMYRLEGTDRAEVTEE